MQDACRPTAAFIRPARQQIRARRSRAGERPAAFRSAGRTPKAAGWQFATITGERPAAFQSAGRTPNVGNGPVHPADSLERPSSKANVGWPFSPAGRAARGA